MNAMIELIRTRRSIRKYKDTKVEQEKIDILLKAALMSPASKRSNPWSFVVIDDTEIIQQLSTSKPHGADFLKGAPLAIVVCADPQKSDVWVEDTSIASILLQLTAQDLGLGSCWIQVRKRTHENGSYSEAYIQKLLSIPQDIVVESIIAIGYPDEVKTPFQDEKLLKNRLYHNSFTQNWELK